LCETFWKENVMKLDRFLLGAFLAVGAVAACVGSHTVPPSTCKPMAAACSQDNDCCSLGCVDGGCACNPNVDGGGVCATTPDCCSPGICSDNACTCSALHGLCVTAQSCCESLTTCRNVGADGGTQGECMGSHNFRC